MWIRFWGAGHNRQVIELRKLKDVAMASTETTNEDEMISKWSDLIPTNAFTDNFGVILFSQDQDKLIMHPSYWSKSKIRQKSLRLEDGIIGKVAQTGSSMRVGDIKNSTRFLERDSKSRSALCVPIKIGHEVIGVINAESMEVDNFAENDEQLLLTFTNQIASGIGRLRNEEAQIRKRKQLKILNQLSSLLAGVLEEKNLFRIVVQNLQEQLDYLGAYIFSINEEDETIQLEDHHGSSPPSKNGHIYSQSISKGLLGKAVRENKLMVSNRVSEDDNYLKVQGIENVGAEIIIPIKMYKKNSYLLALSSELSNAFGEDEIAAFKTLADHISVSLESINLFKATRRQLKELTVLHAISNSVVNAQDEMEMLERATEIIGATLYPDIFGFLLIDESMSHLRVHPSYRGVDERAKDRLVGLNEGISGRVATSGKAMWISDVRDYPEYIVINPDIRSELSVPLIGSKGVIGVINAESVELDAFTNNDMRLLSTIAGQLGTAIEKLRLFEAEKMQRVQAETLQEVAAILGEASYISKVADLILEELNSVVPFESASIQIIDEDDLVISAVAGALSKDILGYRLPIKEDKRSHPMLEENRAAFYGNIKEHPDWLLAPGTENVESWIGAPLISRGKCIGVLTVDGYKLNQFNIKDSQLVSSFAIHAAIAIENSRLFKEIEDSYSQTVSALANAIDVRDSYTNDHSQRLAKLAIETGRHLNCSRKEVDAIYWAALLHDIGKISVPDEILRKPSKLTKAEFSIIKEHPAIGERIIEPIKKNIMAVDTQMD
jgi:putative methionine-R-sulfoxide reductase with GAF domain